MSKWPQGVGTLDTLPYAAYVGSKLNLQKGCCFFLIKSVNHTLPGA